MLITAPHVFLIPSMSAVAAVPVVAPVGFDLNLEVSVIPDTDTQVFPGLSRERIVPQALIAYQPVRFFAMRFCHFIFPLRTCV